ncbi:MAG: putative lipid II flippase FtsW [Pseudomonadota bacterium]|nr:putative lipid II flippase FtsW [Pseudomonadota bacterium]
MPGFWHDFTLDIPMFCSALLLLGLGLLMVTSSSMVISEQQFGTPFHFLLRQLIHVGIGIALSLVAIRVDISTWQRTSVLWLFLSIILLVLVLIPGIGRHVNGSVRWIYIGPISLQVSELAKISVVIYLAGYLVRRAEEVQRSVTGFLKPMVVLGLMAFLLLMEPDFGATSVIMATALAMMFLAGVRIWQYAVMFFGVAIALAALALTSPYRLARLTTFLDPWANQFDSGYQLTQSLIAFGRGGVFGVGLGDSIQKLFYLPEAHTDFLFAVLAEELGLIGEIAIISLYCILVGRVLWLGRKAYELGHHFAAYLSYGLGLWLAFQAMVNIGVNAGLLPTKGLTLPLMSYGGSSIIINCVVIAILLRISSDIAPLPMPSRKPRASSLFAMK